MGIRNMLKIALVLSGALLGGAMQASAAPNGAPVENKAAQPIIVAQCTWILFASDEINGQTYPALRVRSTDGVNGYWVGESWMSQKPEDVQPVLDKMKGQDVTSPKAAWDAMSAMGMPYVLKLALDIAIWDLYGRSQGKPVAALLGPRKRDKVAMYCTGAPNLTAQQYVGLARQAKARGLRGVKINPFLSAWSSKRDPANAEAAAKWLASDMEIIKAVRAEVGDAYPLLYDGGGCYNLQQATQVGELLDQLHFALFYDPMPAKGAEDQANFLAIKKAVTLPICASFAGASVDNRLDWLNKKALDFGQIDIPESGGFTPCVRMVRSCDKAGVSVDVHGTSSTDYYQFPLYCFVDDKTLPWMGWLMFSPQSLPVATEFPASISGDKHMPWITRLQARPVDAEGYMHLNYDIPGMGVEYDWDWITRHDVMANQPKGAMVIPHPGPMNAEANGNLEMVRPFLDPDFNPPFGPERNRPAAKAITRQIADALPAKLSTPVKQKRKILAITCRTLGQLHIPGAAGLLALLRDAEQKYGAFEVTEVYSTDVVTAELLSKFDAVVLNNISQHMGTHDDELYNTLLPNYVKNGGGLFALHGVALIYAQQPTAAFNKLLGGVVMLSPLNNSMVHPAKNHCSPFTVKLLEPANPLLSAFHGPEKKMTLIANQLNGGKRIEWPVSIDTPHELVDELYVFTSEPDKDHATRELMSVDLTKEPEGMYPPPVNDFSHAITWIRPNGKGRVYYTGLGHNQSVYSIPCVAQAMLDGLLYVTGDLTIPDGAGADHQ